MPSGDFLYVIWFKRYEEKTRKKIDFLAKVTPDDGTSVDMRLPNVNSFFIIGKRNGEMHFFHAALWFANGFANRKFG